MKKLVTGALFSVFVVAALVAFRDHAVAMWAVPERQDRLEKVVEKQQETQEKQMEYTRELQKQSEIQSKMLEVQMQIQRDLQMEFMRRGKEN